ncbi:hypothetical protein CFS9_15050 [Flavobacterium sp. CFS9]|uniref:Uncharacterized protein n=1 Tax=Flavobacterium sp. CFS9 TaxID=3143118 RepID=A0AAT9H053_9FLAO
MPQKTIEDFAVILRFTDKEAEETIFAGNSFNYNAKTLFCLLDKIGFYYSKKQQFEAALFYRPLFAVSL